MGRGRLFYWPVAGHPGEGTDARQATKCSRVHTGLPLYRYPWSGIGHRAKAFLKPASVSYPAACAAPLPPKSSKGSCCSFICISFSARIIISATPWRAVPRTSGGISIYLYCQLSSPQLRGYCKGPPGYLVGLYRFLCFEGSEVASELGYKMLDFFGGVGLAGVDIDVPAECAV